MNITVNTFGDQFFWGCRVYELGTGPAPIKRVELTAAKLAMAIKSAVNDESINRKANELEHQIGAEDGVGTEAELIETFIRKRHF